MDKRTRQRIIKEIVAGQPIVRQKELRVVLKERGFDVTQATISRDIAQIPLQKVRTSAGLVYHWQGLVSEPNSRLARMVGEFVIAIDRSDNLVLLRANPGTAPTVAASIDEARLDPVLGTIAGDDTVLVVAKDKEAGKRALDLLVKMQET